MANAATMWIFPAGSIVPTSHLDCFPSGQPAQQFAQQCGFPHLRCEPANCDNRWTFHAFNMGSFHWFWDVHAPRPTTQVPHPRVFDVAPVPIPSPCLSFVFLPSYFHIRQLENKTNSKTSGGKLDGLLN